MLCLHHCATTVIDLYVDTYVQDHWGGNPHSVEGEDVVLRVGLKERHGKLEL